MYSPPQGAEFTQRVERVQPSAPPLRPLRLCGECPVLYAQVDIDLADVGRYEGETLTSMGESSPRANSSTYFFQASAEVIFPARSQAKPAQ